MDNEEADQQGSSQRAKIVIRKCKKESGDDGEKSSSSSLKKVNGELSNDDDEGEREESAENIKVVKASKVRPKGTKTITIRSVKRKRPQNKSPVHEVLEEEINIIHDKKYDDGDGKSETTSIEFKGFKKRIIAQSEKVQDSVNDEVKESTDTSEIETESKTTYSEPERPATDLSEESELGTKPKIIKLIKGKKKADDSQGESQAEYAQYLGLQPTMQFKCYRCGEKGFPSLLALNVHQRSCGVMRKSNFIANIQQDQMSPSDPNMLTNFRITRKVYLCSACGTYYENWNLFLHMRDVHKKHICLLCLAMFGVADKLADHLKGTHNIIESTFISIDDFQNTYKGSFYLICCVCENMFNERDDFISHECVKKDPTAKCTICGVKCGHYYTCPNSNSPRTLPGTVSSSPTLTVTTSPGALVKYSGPSSKKKTEQTWQGKKGPGKRPLENDDEYDVSHAASFCHVDIGDEAGEKGKREADDDPIDITQDDSTDEATCKMLDKVPNSEQSKLTSPTITKKDSVIDSVDKETEESDEKVQKESETVHFKDTSESGKEADRIDNDKINNVEKRDDEINIRNADEETNTKMYDTDEVERASEHEVDMNVNDKQQDILKNVEETEAGPLLVEKSNSTTHSLDSMTATNDQLIQEEDLVKSNSDGEPINNTVINDECNPVASSEDNFKEVDAGPFLNSPKDDSSCESDSDKSGLVVDETPKRQKPLRQKAESRKKKGRENSPNKAENQIVKQQVSNEDTSDINFDIDSDRKEHEGEKENVSNNVCPETSDWLGDNNDGIPLAKDDVPAMALTLEDKLQDASSQSVVKECVRTSCLNCAYCSHAVKIAVNGKQLALHLLAEHRYKPVKNNETIDDVTLKLKKSLDILDPLFFNTESYDSSDQSLNMPYDNTYECFQCQFMTRSHKDLYVHKRKMHQKTVMLCVMCKSTFYSYSELLCHLCPGDNVSEDIYFRCCFCNLGMIPSAFRLMVHLRKSHHTCDICLEVAGDQSKLSTHMWKHKLNHLCYRCGIAYRNKPDITKHLFWKHGTESVLCKKCLQKKWPHVYHFCIPPTEFICEECNASFKRAVALKVHKRLHAGELPYKCSQCDKKFVSKRLLSKHEDAHNQPILNEASNFSNVNVIGDSTEDHINVETVDDNDLCKLKENDPNEDSKDKGTISDTAVEPKSKKKKKKEKKNKTVVDVYDLPPLNLSSESDSSDAEAKETNTDTSKGNAVLAECQDKKQELFGDKSTNIPLENVDPHEENQTPAPIVDGVWDNFHSYKAELEKRDLKDLSLPNILPSTSSDGVKLLTSADEIIKPSSDEVFVDHIIMDHSYCLIPGKPRSQAYGDDDGQELPDPNASDEKPLELSDATANNNNEGIPGPRSHSSSIDHPYATLNNTAEGTVPAPANGIASAITELPSSQGSNTETLTDSQGGSQPIAKKKQKTPKKKKENVNSSSSSDSSSDSDSSCCSNCKSNCSCSSNSSSNSSSSSSSDSDSSTPEGRQRALDRKEKKKDRIKHKHSKEDNLTKPRDSKLMSTGLKVAQTIESVVNVPKAPVEPPIRESDLDTDESSTDEDFYDRYPQSHAKQQMEKNKLMLLASVAPVNNGSVSPLEPASGESNTPSSLGKKKLKSKKRKKSLTLKKTSKKGGSSQSQSRPSTSSVNVPTATSSPFFMTSNSQNLIGKTSSPLLTPISNIHSDTAGGSGSDNESSRLSKRKRVRNKFYGYSSGEEDQERPGTKWKKLDTVISTQAVNSIPIHSYLPPPKSSRQISTASQGKMVQKPNESSGSEDESPAKKEEFTNSTSSSSSSSDSDNEIESKPVVQKEQTEKNDSLYCYCQCPYDEVSEMIACDGQDCTIEWFHFECVGIMVPPKGKWYCPDCRKRRDLI